MNRIQKMANFFRILFSVFLVLIPLATGLIWLNGGGLLFGNDGLAVALDIFRNGRDVYLSPDLMPPLPLPWDIRLLGLAASMLPIGIVLLSLWWLIRLFTRFTKGEVFSGATVRYISRLGWTMIAGVAAAPVYDALLTLVLTMHNPPGKHIISISLESADIEDLIVATIIILVSWIMDEGRKLRETEELTI